MVGFVRRVRAVLCLTGFLRAMGGHTTYIYLINFRKHNDPKFKVILNYVVSSRTVWATLDLVSKTNRKGWGNKGAEEKE